MLDAKVRYSAAESSDCLTFDSDMLLEKAQNTSIAMLRTATAAMGVRRPEVGACSAEMAGGCVAYSGSDVPLTCAIGVGTSGPIGSDDIAAIEAFYASRNSPVRIAISGRTHDGVNGLLAGRGYTAGVPMENWWKPLADMPGRAIPDNLQVEPASIDDAELW